MSCRKNTLRKKFKFQWQKCNLKECFRACFWELGECMFGMNLPGQKLYISIAQHNNTDRVFRTSPPERSCLCQFCRHHSIHTCLFCGQQFTKPLSLLALVTTAAASRKRQSQAQANSEDSVQDSFHECFGGYLGWKSWIIGECESGYQVCQTTEGLRKEQNGRPNIREPCVIPPLHNFFSFPSTLPFYM